VAESLLRYGSDATAQTIVGAYDAFLARMDDSSVRHHLEDLPPEGAENDTILQELSGISRDFQRGLQQLFVDDSAQLASLTREYGVF
jgi:hypothetical protein